MIKITDLEKVYRTEEVETIALNKLSIEVKEGEFLCCDGPIRLRQINPVKHPGFTR